jgi:hypothetical protein
MQARIESLCRKLGRRPQGLKSSDIIIGMSTSDDLIELRDTLYRYETLKANACGLKLITNAALSYHGDLIELRDTLYR